MRSHPEETKGSGKSAPAAPGLYVTWLLKQRRRIQLGPPDLIAQAEMVVYTHVQNEFRANGREMGRQVSRLQLSHICGFEHKLQITHLTNQSITYPTNGKRCKPRHSIAANFPINGAISCKKPKTSICVYFNSLMGLRHEQDLR